MYGLKPVAFKLTRCRAPRAEMPRENPAGWSGIYTHGEADLRLGVRRRKV
jgi:hypothetical protein